MLARCFHFIFSYYVAHQTMSICKLVVLPVFAVLFEEALSRTSLLNRDDKVLRFVILFISVMPVCFRSSKA